MVATGTVILPLVGGATGGTIVQVGAAVNIWVISSGLLVTVQVVSWVLNPEPAIDTVAPSLAAPGEIVMEGENGLTVKVALAVSPELPFIVTTYWPLVAPAATGKPLVVN